jgi:hypothetical protein
MTDAPAMMMAVIWAASLSVWPAATMSRATKDATAVNSFLLVSFLMIVSLSMFPPSSPDPVIS